MNTAEKALVIIPTYNERENIVKISKKIFSLSYSIDLLIVDDNSPDGTGELADELARQAPERMYVLHRSVKDGLGRAYFC